ncbi:hypothetical protein BHE74_00053126 [Ensete ventricosum]|nr:hypothetical protein BHE74_00053126 [Ensete ventricosum]RZS06557.1 hypothetical protein BHM03_00037233 [Ensete ventricosum]
MSEEPVPSRYVKLTKEHDAPLEEIRPGELNQPVHVPQNSPCDPCMVHCCMHWCAICQEHREMKGRLSDNLVMPMTVVNPPPVQEMSNRNSEVPETAPEQTQHVELETQAL